MKSYADYGASACRLKKRGIEKIQRERKYGEAYLKIQLRGSKMYFKKPSSPPYTTRRVSSQDKAFLLLLFIADMRNYIQPKLVCQELSFENPAKASISSALFSVKSVTFTPLIILANSRFLPSKSRG